MNENNDWPASLRLSAARDQLAQVIYMARAEAYAIGSPHWEGLSPAVRDSYRKTALEVLETLRPPPHDYFWALVNITRRHDAARRIEMEDESAFTPMFLESCSTLELVALQHELRAHHEDQPHLNQVLLELRKRDTKKSADDILDPRD